MNIHILIEELNTKYATPPTNQEIVEGDFYDGDIYYADNPVGELNPEF